MFHIEVLNLVITHTLGFATFNPVAASPLLGFGTPPKQINFSILDMFGLNDDTIPYSQETSFGIGPYGSLIAYDGYYFEDHRCYTLIINNHD